MNSANETIGISLYFSLFVFANEDSAARTLVTTCLRAFCVISTFFNISLASLAVLSRLGAAPRKVKLASAAVFSAVFTSVV